MKKTVHNIIYSFFLILLMGVAVLNFSTATASAKEVLEPSCAYIEIEEER